MEGQISHGVGGEGEGELKHCNLQRFAATLLRNVLYTCFFGCGGEGKSEKEAKH